MIVSNEWIMFFFTLKISVEDVGLGIRTFGLNINGYYFLII